VQSSIALKGIGNVQTQDRTGQRYGNYRLIRHIGHGGYAEVYLAEHIHLPNRQCAIKLLTGTNLEDSQREEFLGEARIVADLLNDHIVKIFDFGVQIDANRPSSGGIPYFAMEYAAGGTLRKLYNHGSQVPLDRIKLYVNQIAGALQYAHSKNPAVVHSDIKPENMLLKTLDHVLLSDFGTAFTGQTGLLLKPTKIVGTATYIAPERLNHMTKRASDQYSLGIVVYEWLCGFPPFDGIDAQEIILMHLKMQPEPLYATYPHVTREIDAVVRRALEKVPENRFLTVQEFAQALEMAINNAPQQQAQIWLPPTIVTPGIGNNSTITNTGQLPAQQPQPLVGQSPAQPPQQSQTPTSPLSAQPPQPPQPQQPTIQSQLPNGQMIAPPLQVQHGQSSPDRFEIAQMFAPPPTVAPIAPMLPVQHGQSSLDRFEIAQMFASRSTWSSSAPTQPSPTPDQFVTRFPGLTNRGRSLGRVSGFFELSSQFAMDQKNRVFRTVSIMLNVLSAILLFLLLVNVYIALLGLLLSLVMFALCVWAVDEKLAIFSGVIVALYWGAVGWVIDSSLLPWLNLNGYLPPIVVGILFFVGSLSVHIWYVLRKI